MDVPVAFTTMPLPMTPATLSVPPASRPCRPVVIMPRFGWICELQMAKARKRAEGAPCKRFLSSHVPSLFLIFRCPKPTLTQHTEIFKVCPSSSTTARSSWSQLEPDNVMAVLSSSHFPPSSPIFTLPTPRTHTTQPSYSHEGTARGAATRLLPGPAHSG